MIYFPTSPVFARNHVTPSAFRSVLIRRNSPAIIEANAIYEVLVGAGIDPAVFLGQFAAESSYGTSGYARTTRSPGNIVISRPLLPHWTRAFGGRPWKAPNGRTYAAFLNWRNGTRAYVALMQSYRLRGWARTIATMASRWLGMADATHSGYVHNIVTHAALVPVTLDPAPKPTPTPTPDPVPPAPPPAPKHPISATPRIVPLQQPDQSLAVYGWATPRALTLGEHPGWVYFPTTFPGRLPVEGKVFPVVVTIPGGPLPLGGAEHMSAIASNLVGRGCVVFEADYRSMAQYGGGWPATFRDVASAIADARRLAPIYGGDPSRVTLVAHSFGGFPGSVMALRSANIDTNLVGDKPDAYVSLAGLSSKDQVSVNNVEFAGAPDPRSVIGERRIPVHVIQGDADPVALLQPFSASFAADLARAGYDGSYTVVSGAGHDSIMSAEATMKVVLAAAKGEWNV